MLYKVILPFESVVEILKCDHSNEIYMYLAVLSTGALYNYGLVLLKSQMKNRNIVRIIFFSFWQHKFQNFQIYSTKLKFIDSNSATFVCFKLFL